MCGIIKIHNSAERHGVIVSILKLRVLVMEKQRRAILNNNGFTLVEVLAVVIILGVLAGVVIPSVSNYIDKAKKTDCETRRNIIMSEYITYSRLYGERSVSDVLAGNDPYIDIAKYKCPSGGKLTYSAGEISCSIHSDRHYFLPSSDKHLYASDVIGVWNDYLEFLKKSGITGIKADSDGVVTYDNNKNFYRDASFEAFLKNQLGVNDVLRQNFTNMKIVMKEPKSEISQFSGATVASVYYKVGSNWYIVYADTGNRYGISNSYGKDKTNWMNFVRDEQALASLLGGGDVWKE